MDSGRHVSQEQLGELEAAVAASALQSGAEHPATLDARMRLALAYRECGRDRDALDELEQVANARDRVLGPNHPETLAARHELAMSYFHVGIGNGNARLTDAITTMDAAAEGRARALGGAHPETLKSWTSLAMFCGASVSYLRDPRLPVLRERIISGREQIVAEREQAAPDDPDTQAARVELANAYRSAGRDDDERRLLEQVAAS